jgi:hypothetical protein
VPVRDNEDKRTQKTLLSANSPNCARNWPTWSWVLLVPSPENLVKFGTLVPRGYGMTSQRGSYGLWYYCPSPNTLTPNLSQNSSDIFSQTSSIVTDGNPSVLGTWGSSGRLSLCRPSISGWSKVASGIGPWGTLVPHLIVVWYGVTVFGSVGYKKYSTSRAGGVMLWI